MMRDNFMRLSASLDAADHMADQISDPPALFCPMMINETFRSAISLKKKEARDNSQQELGVNGHKSPV